MLIILTKFHNDWQEIVDILAVAKFWASLIFFASVSSCDKSRFYCICFCMIDFSQVLKNLDDSAAYEQ